MRGHAPSLDMIAGRAAADRGAQISSEDAAGQDDSAQDSRSSSSASSPAPAEYEESDFFLGANDSQSSLGVGNLQDMQVTDDLCLPPVERLPSEILICIFSKLGQASDLLHCMLVCKRWARNAVDILWHRPACTSWPKHKVICNTLSIDNSYFAYRDFIKRLNLAALAEKVNDGSVLPLASCTRVERLTLTNCKGLTDTGLTALVRNCSHLLALDISGDDQITDASIVAIAENCRRLQGLNTSNCSKISNESMIKLAHSCRYIKRLKLNDCNQLTDDAITAFAENCPNILEIDLHQCRLVGNDPVTALLAKGQSLRELRLSSCELIDDSAFLSLPSNRTYEHLRILDLTSCTRLTDRAVEKIIDVAPRLRNLVLAKCRNITDAAVYAISRLGKNLHYVHLGHCGHITDDAVKRLVACCNRIRYIDLGCCIHLTDDSVMRLATLPKLKRIGLVKCANITDDSVYALARANHRVRQRRDADGNISDSISHSSLERVHLSYCTNLTLKSIVRLLNTCPRLTHLSLTGVQAFLRRDLEQFCRDAPPGAGVIGLRHYLNMSEHRTDQYPLLRNEGRNDGMPHGADPHHAGDGALEDQDVDIVDDDEVIDDASEMLIDVPPMPAPSAGHQIGYSHGQAHAPNPGHDFVTGGVEQNIVPPPPPPPLPVNPFAQARSAEYIVPVPQAAEFHGNPVAFAQMIESQRYSTTGDPSMGHHVGPTLSSSAPGPSSHRQASWASVAPGLGASAAPIGSQTPPTPGLIRPPMPTHNSGEEGSGGSAPNGGGNGSHLS